MKKGLLRRIGLGFPGLILLILLLLQTTPVEQAVWQLVVKKAAEFGLEVKASRFDISPFRLAVRIRDLRVKGLGLDLSLHHVDANASAGLLLGRISMDSLNLEDGFVIWKRQPSPEIKQVPTSAGFAMPGIMIDFLRVSGVEVSLQELATNVNLEAEQLTVDYAKNLLDTRFLIPAATLAGMPLPEFSASLHAETERFQRFDNIDISVISEKSSLKVTGAVNEMFHPNLSMEFEAGSDLPLGFPAHLSARVDPFNLFLNLDAEPDLAGEFLAVNLNTTIDYRSMPLRAPIAVSVKDVAEAHVNLEWDGQELAGDTLIDLKSYGIQCFAPLPEIGDGRLTASFFLPAEDPDSLEARLALRIGGLPSVDLTGTIRDGQLVFNLNSEPIPEASLFLSGVASRSSGVSAFARLNIPDPTRLQPYLDVPPELCAGPVFFRGGVTWDGETVNLKNMQLSASNLVWENQLLGNINGIVSGPPERIKGKLYSDLINPDQPFVSFVLNSNTQTWDAIELNIDSQPINPAGVLPGDVAIILEASGQGPLTNPSLSGLFDIMLTDRENLAHFTSPFDLANRVLKCHKLEMESADLGFNGQLALLFDDALDWKVHILAYTLKNRAYKSLLHMDLPAVTLEIQGDRKSLSASLDIEEQSIIYDTAPIFVDPAGALVAEISPDSGSLDGILPEIMIGGITFSNLTVTLLNQHLALTTNYKISDPQAMAYALCNYWPEDLAAGKGSGVIQLDSDLSFKEPRAVLVMDELDGSFRDAPFDLKDAEVLYDGKIHFSQFPAHFLGTEFIIEQASSNQKTLAFADVPPPADQSDIAVSVDFSLNNTEPLRQFIGELWPEYVEITPFSGQFGLFSDLNMADPAAFFRLDDLFFEVMNNPVEALQVSGSYHNGLWMNPFEVEVGGLQTRVMPRDDGFRIMFEPTAENIGVWYDQVTGDAIFDVVIDWENGDGKPKATAVVNQYSGRLILLDPFLAMSNWHLNLDLDIDGNINIQSASGMVNGGTVEMGGHLISTPTGMNILVNTYLDKVQMDVMLDYHLNVTAAAEYRSDGKVNKITSTLFLNEGYLNPEINVKSLVEAIANEVPELYFPDPILKDIELQMAVLVKRESPIVAESDMFFLELSMPTLLIRGNLAEPRIALGNVDIHPGGQVKLGNQGFAFKDSQVLFFEDRPGDPYLDITLESTDFQNKNTISLNGFMSSLGESLGENNLNDIIATFLVSQVVSFVSLENVQTGTVFENSATAVASQRIQKRLLARYSFPIFEPENQRVELIYGPVRYNYLTLSDQKGILGSSLLHSRSFGYPDGERPIRISKVVFDPEIPRSIKRRLALSREDHYSPTQWRHAELQMKRYLKSKGYLKPNLAHEFVDRVLTVHLDTGPQTRLNVEGLVLSEKEKIQILSRVYSTNESGLRDVGTRLENIAVTRGFAAAAAMVDMDENDIYAYVITSPLLENPVLDFQDGNDVLGGLYKKDQERRNFIALNFSSDTAAREQLRARLAAKGYLLPTIERGDFLNLNTFKMPVVPGRRGQLIGITEGNMSVESSLIGQPFEYGQIGKLRLDLEKQFGRNIVFDIIPRRQGQDVVLELTRTELKEPRIEALEVATNGRIKPKTIRRFLHFKPDMLQSDLVRSQRKLTENGPFIAARLQSMGSQTLLTLEERNHFDTNIQFTWDERRQFGSAVQFTNHQLFKGINDLSANLHRNELDQGSIVQARFQRILGTLLDFTTGAEWNNELRDDIPELKLGDGFIIPDQLDYQTTEQMGVNTGLSYPLTQYQTLSWDVEFLRKKLNNLLIPVEEPQSAGELVVNRQDNVNTRLSWLYRHLDNRTDPRNGIFLAVGLERLWEILPKSSDGFEDPFGDDPFGDDPFGDDPFGDGDFGDGNFDSGGDSQATRLTLKLTTFKSRNRLMWTNRIEGGFLERQNPTQPANPEDSSLFVLGGNTNLRGFAINFAGPLEVVRIQNVLPEDVNGGSLAVQPLGGEAMFFTSQELVYDFGYQGVGVAGFVDGGWVWRDRSDFLDGLVYTGGLGLVWNSPVGYFRLDWAKPISEGPFEKLLKSLDDPITPFDESEWARKIALSRISFRFGRVF